MHTPEQEGSRLQTLGYIILIASCGFTALEQGGFGFGINLSLKTCLIIATVGGAVGGMFLDIRRWWAALIGGAVAGPCGLLFLSWYLTGRNQVWTLELVLVQGIASLPGYGLYWLLRLLGPKVAEDEHEELVVEEVAEHDDRPVKVLPPTALRFKDPQEGQR